MSKRDLSTVDIYRVGLLSDLHRLYAMLRHGPASLRRPRILWIVARRMLRSIGRRSYWNGYLAETEGITHCGHGWTKRRAMRSLQHIQATTHWATHQPCGTKRLTADVRRSYCVVCGVSSSRREWTETTATAVTP